MKNLRLYILTSIFVLLILSKMLLPNIVLNIGKSYVENGNYFKAYKVLNFGLKINPSNKAIRYYYVKTLTMFKSTYKIQQKIFEFSQSKYDDSAKTLALTKLGEWRYQISQNYGRTYIDYAPYNNKILRWDTRSFPLSVYIENTANIGLPNYYKDEIKKGFTGWERAVDFVKFKYIDNKKVADIIVEFIPPVNSGCTEKGCKYVVAYTAPEIKSNRLKKMTIKVYSKDPRGNFLSNKELHNTILHEIGHALGIMGHSYNHNDLMYMATNQNQLEKTNIDNFMYITAADINTLRLLYALGPDITDHALNKINFTNLLYPPLVLGDADEVKSKKLDEAERYVKSAPNISGGYIDLGVAYAEKGKLKEARQAFDKAISLAKTKEERSLAYYNLAVISLNTNKTADALRYAQKAQKIYPKTDNEELILMIRQQMGR